MFTSIRPIIRRATRSISFKQLKVSPCSLHQTQVCVLISMRIQIEIDPSVIKRPLPPASAPPLIQIGGEMVIMELQGDLTFEGEPGGKVIGLLGLERMVRHPPGSG